MFRPVLLLATLAASLAAVSGLSCFCGTSPCQTPTCCDSGYYTTDACGCCLTCAQPEEAPCGGPFKTTGTCAAGLRCLRQCECKSKQGKQCVFPFTYKGETHNKCTDADSENGSVWCATEVDEDGEVVRNTWEDCEEGCPGTNFECNEGFLFNVNGNCVNGTDAPALLRFLQTKPLAVSLDDQPDELSQKEAPLCPISPRDASETTCGCTSEPVTKDLAGHPRGGCIPPLVDHGIEELGKGWCFLVNVEDSENPTKNCFQDTKWSPADGRFYSNEACLVPGRQAKAVVEDVLEQVVEEVVEGVDVE